MYRIILFDVDDTLLDFKAGELKSLAKMFARLNLTYSPRIEASYLKINASLWRDYEAGRITRPELFDVRFAKLFRHHHIEADPHLAERTYHHFLDQEAILLPRVLDTLDALQDYRLFIVSNGIEPVQRERLASSGLLITLKIFLFLIAWAARSRPWPFLTMLPNASRGLTGVRH